MTTGAFLPGPALAKANWTLVAGYSGIFNNCLDHVMLVLEAYGVLGLPSRHSHPSPKDWFGLLAGEIHNL